MPQFSQWIRPQRRGLLVSFDMQIKSNNSINFLSCKRFLFRTLIQKPTCAKFKLHSNKFELDSIRIFRIALYLK